MKKILFVAAAAVLLLSGCATEMQNLQNSISETMGQEKKEEIIYTTEQNVKLDHTVIDNIKVEKTLSQGLKESMNDLHKISTPKDDYKKFLINDELFQIQYSTSRGELYFNLYNLKTNKKVVTFDKNYEVNIFDDTDINNKIYFGLKKIYKSAYTATTYNKIDKLYSFDGKNLKLERENIDEKNLYYGDMRIISHVAYINKYIVYTIHTKDYNRYEVVNAFNDKQIKFKATILGIKHNKALITRKIGSALFNSTQYQLSVIDLDTGEETMLMIETEGKESMISFYESKSQFIVSLPNGQNIDIVSMKNVIGSLDSIQQLKANIYNIDGVYSEETEMSLDQLNFSISTNFDDTRPVLIND
ncbi:MAG: hypothetical protein AB7D96_02435 [Arcobacteraceae bacterium]